jgi:hypothetical protein
MKYILLFSIIFILLACDEDGSCSEDTCSVTDPIEELEWLRSEIKNFNTTYPFIYVSMASYYGKTVFMVKNCDPSALTLPPIIMNCNGEALGYLSETEGSFNYNGVTIHNVNPNKVRCTKVIWTPDNFACQVDI